MKVRYQVAVVAFIALTLLTTSCIRTQKLKLVQPVDVFNRYGRVENYSFDNSKKKVINFFDVRCIGMVMDYTPTGKIDRLIKNNPDYDFIFLYK